MEFLIFNLKRIRSKDLAIWNHGSCVTGVIGSQCEEGCREGDVIEMFTHFKKLNSHLMRKSLMIASIGKFGRHEHLQ